MPTTEIYQVVTISVVVLGFLISFVVRTNQNAALKSHIDQGIARVEGNQALQKQEHMQLDQKIEDHIQEVQNSRKAYLERNDQDHKHFFTKIGQHDTDLAVIKSKLKTQ